MMLIQKKRLMAVFMILALFFTANCSTARAEGTTIEDIPQPVLDARNSVFHVYTLLYDEDGEIIGYISGAAFGCKDLGLTDLFPPYVITAMTNVYPYGMGVEFARYKVVVLANGEIYNVEKFGAPAGTEYDIAFLYLEKPIPGQDLVFRRTATVKNGENIYALGFPEPEFIYDPQFESYASQETVEIGKILKQETEDAGLSYILSSVAIQRNGVGGPIVDSEGNVIGMATRDSNKQGNYVVPSREITDMLNDMGMPMPWSAEMPDISSKSWSPRNLKIRGDKGVIEAEYTLSRNDGAVQLSVSAYPVEECITADLDYEWTVSDESVLQLKPTDKSSSTYEIIGTEKGQAVLTVTCGKTSKSISIYVQ